MFDATVNLGNILTIGAVIVGGFGAFHRWDKKIETRHAVNVQKMDTLVKTVEAGTLSAKDLQATVEDTQRSIIALSGKIDSHVQSDEVKHDDVNRRLDRLER